jgi:uncharacterized protein (DUF1330 family)
MPAHLIAFARSIKDPERYQEYTAQVRSLIAAAGGEPIVGGPVAETLVGSSDASAVAVIRFPDIQALEDWYRSDAYQALVPVRDAAADITLLTLASE